MSYLEEHRGGRLRLRLDQTRDVPRDAPPSPEMPLTLVLLDAFTADPHNGETLDTARDCGQDAPHGVALVGEAHLVEAARVLVRDALVEVAEWRRDGRGPWRTVEDDSPATDDDSLLTYWYRPTPAGHALLREHEKALDRYHDARP